MTTDKRTYAERKEYFQKWTAENKEKRRQYLKNWYEKNKEANKEKGYRWRSKVRFSFQEYKSTLKCVHCGESDPICLDFHHIDPTTKERNLSKGIASLSFKKLLEEVEKCIVLCSNCHRKEHRRLKTLAANNENPAT